MLSFFSGLKCLTCGAHYPPSSELYACPKCAGSLDATYDYASAAKCLTREAISHRPRVGIWRYAELLPVEDESHIVTMGEGNTALIRSRRLAADAGLKHLYLKLETQNPSGSFKDRQISVGVSKTIEFCKQVVAVGVSSGNVASSTAAYAARAGLTSYVITWGFIPGVGSGRTKVLQAVVYGANVAVTRRGLTPIPALAKEMVSITKDVALQRNWVPLLTTRTVNPYCVEGTKTLIYEIMEDLDWQAPDWIVLPVGGGSLVVEAWKAINELLTIGLIEQAPRLAAVGGPGCGVTHALEQGRSTVEEAYQECESRGIEFYFSPEGEWALNSVRESRGMGLTLKADEAEEGIRRLAHMEGLFAEPLGSWAVTGTHHLARKGVFSTDDLVVAVVTGSGLKDVDTLNKLCSGVNIPEVDLENLAYLDKLFGD